MISIVLYGRNDSYGYNLHKRAALSLNCIAELLTDPDDEILFVDYNTPDDFPTFPEAIQDTLTPKAKARLRTFRVRPSIHARFKGRTHLQALEPVARNIAVRRSNPANRWILSTNTDMIFVPRNGQSLTDMVRDLPRGYYGIPRFEIPESLWESLDRADAPGTIRTVGEWGWKFHLNEIVYGVPTIKFDAPGDFQLIDREDFHRIHGFNEEMLLGWHVDSNICKRLFILYGEVGDLSDRLFGYHCDHTRQVTPMHKRAAAENSLAKFVDGANEPTVPAQADSWGCADDAIECMHLASGSSQRYIEGLSAAVLEPMRVPTQVAYVRAAYDEIGYDPSHILPYLMDVLSSAPRDWSIAWVGVHEKMFGMFCTAWVKMGFTGQIHAVSGSGPVASSADGIVRYHADAAGMISVVDAFILDFSGPSGEALGPGNDVVNRAAIVQLLNAFHAIVADELSRSDDPSSAPRRLIAVNAIHNRFEPLMRGCVEFARSPFSGRLRHGYVSGPAPWFGQMTLKAVGERKDGKIQVGSGERGHVVSGPYITILPGRYTVEVEIAPGLPSIRHWPRLFGLMPHRPKSERERLQSVRRAEMEARAGQPVRQRWKKRGAVAIEIRNGLKVLVHSSLSVPQLLARTRHSFTFYADPEDFASLEPPEVVLRIWSGGYIPFSIRRIDLKAVRLS
jgi:hypothetical protein